MLLGPLNQSSNRASKTRRDIEARLSSNTVLESERLGAPKKSDKAGKRDMRHVPVSYAADGGASGGGASGASHDFLSAGTTSRVAPPIATADGRTQPPMQRETDFYKARDEIGGMVNNRPADLGSGLVKVHLALHGRSSAIVCGGDGWVKP